VTPEVAQDRLTRLQSQQGTQTLRYHESRIGADALVLIDGSSRRGGAQLSGRDVQNRVVNLDPGAESGLGAGDRVPVRIVAATPHSLLAEPSLAQVSKDSPLESRP
jgi:tRNA-2-methylthio-N6-dimethylallyladenosine synthase